jgi:hypothetical protein
LKRYQTIADCTCDWEYWIGCTGKVIFMSPLDEKTTDYSIDEFMKDPVLI